MYSYPEANKAEFGGQVTLVRVVNLKGTSLFFWNNMYE